MITDEMLRIAAREADQALMSSLPDPSECSHEFSKDFDRKIQKLIRRTRHPVMVMVFRRVACVFVAVVLICSTWLTVDVEARMAFFTWIREQYENFFVYRKDNVELDSRNTVDYRLSWLPAGFVPIDKYELESNTIQVYDDGNGNRIYFSYSKNTDVTSFFVEADYTTVHSVIVNDIKADFYWSKDASVTNSLVWTSEDGTTLFCISAFLEQDELIHMAESVEEQKNK